MSYILILYTCIHIYRVNKSPQSRFKKVENGNYAVLVSRDRVKISVVNCGGLDIVDGNRKIILGIVSQLMRKLVYMCISIIIYTYTSNILIHCIHTYAILIFGVLIFGILILRRYVCVIIYTFTLHICVILTHYIILYCICYYNIGIRYTSCPPSPSRPESRSPTNR